MFRKLPRNKKTPAIKLDPIVFGRSPPHPSPAPNQRGCMHAAFPPLFQAAKALAEVVARQASESAQKAADAEARTRQAELSCSRAREAAAAAASDLESLTRYYDS